MHRRVARSAFGVAIAAGVAFMAAAVAAFTLLAIQEYRMARSVRENAVWAAFQLDREALRFANSLAWPPSPAREAQIRRQFDVLYSKVDLLQSSSFSQNFRSDPELVRAVGEAADEVQKLAAVLDGSPKVLEAETVAALSTLNDRLLPLTNSIAVHANEVNALGVADERAGAIRLYWFLAICVATLGLLGALIIRLLIGQVSALNASRTKLKRLSQELSAKANEALAGSRAKSQFLATMSHEIRTPMNGVIGAVELLTQTPLDGEQRELAHTIGSCGEALLGIINDILDYSKLEAGKMEIEAHAFDLHETVGSVAAMMNPRAAEKRIALNVEIAQDTPRMVVSDQGRIRQILVNLVSNGLKFTKRGAVTITVGYDSEASRLRFVVTDTGMGIAREALGNLFVEFNQLEASMARRFGGTGLGLAICKRLVSLLNGEIGVDSVVGLGTRFWFDVPAQLASETAPAPEQLAQTRPLEILVADDAPVNRQIVGKILNRMGHKVAFAVDGREALEKVAAQAYDLVFMDLQMPEMDGFAAARAIHALPAPAGATLIAALTANASDEDRAACLAAGMNAFASKPVSGQKLRALLANLFGAEAPAMPAPAPAASEPAGRFDEDARAALRAELGDDGMAELDAQFLVDLQGFQAALGGALADRQTDALRAVLHTLRGASGNIGVVSLVEAADRVSGRCKREAFGPALEAEIVGLIGEIEALRASGALGAPVRAEAA